MNRFCATTRIPIHIMKLMFLKVKLAELLRLKIPTQEYMWEPTWAIVWESMQDPMQASVRMYYFGDGRGNDKGFDMGFDVVADMNAL